MLHVPSAGNPGSRIWIVGEAPTIEDELAGRPFYDDTIFEGLLKEAGIDLKECYVTYTCHYRPPVGDMSNWLTTKKTTVKQGFELIAEKYAHPKVVEGRKELLAQIAQHKPYLVIGFGNTTLWALTGQWGITSWRGSEMQLGGGVNFVPTLPTLSLIRQWDQRPQVLHDLKFRCVRRLKQGFDIPSWNFNLTPTLEEVLTFLQAVEGKYVAADIETMNGKTVCLGLASSPRNAICIPFTSYQGTYWTQEELQEILSAIKQAKISWIGQNFSYDRQYIQADFKLDLSPSFDTFVAQSVLFPGTERGLGYLSSIYCDWHSYWKEDGKEWNKGIKDFNKEFRYNCRDACATLEIAQQQLKALEAANLMPQFEDRMRYGDYVYRMMQRGVIRDPERTRRMLRRVEKVIRVKQLRVEREAGHPVNLSSPKQVAALLFKEKGFKAVGGKTASGADSTKDEALKKLVEKFPQAQSICEPILEARSLSTLRANFLEAELDPDGKLRSSWLSPGTETFRLSSSKNAFHRGGPLQNLTDGKHTHSGRALPNLRSTIVPPYGYVYWNCDLERADVQVVAWESDDESLKRDLRTRADVHLVNAVMLFDIKNVPYDECFEQHPRYKEHKEKHEQKRHFGKTFCHATNYGSGARNLAIKTHSTIHQVDLLQRRWFEIHPGIKDWHRRTQAALLGTRTIRNKFGFRRVYFDRVDGLLPEALAWVPQSTVSIYISLVQMAIEDACSNFGDKFGITLQVHDSLTGYYAKELEPIILPLMHEASKKVIVPYADPLYIPLELAISESSWGEVQKRSWNV